MSASLKFLKTTRILLRVLHYVPLVFFLAALMSVYLVAMGMQESLAKRVFMCGSVIILALTAFLSMLQGLAHVDLFAYWKTRYHKAVIASTHSVAADSIGLTLDNFIGSPYKLELLDGLFGGLTADPDALLASCKDGRRRTVLLIFWYCAQCEEAGGFRHRDAVMLAMLKCLSGSGDQREFDLVRSYISAGTEFPADGELNHALLIWQTRLLKSSDRATLIRGSMRESTLNNLLTPADKREVRQGADELLRPD